ncbi:MAG: cupredoxin domain-containing protein [Candidatus Woykebacteria bacterium]
MESIKLAVRRIRTPITLFLTAVIVLVASIYLHSSTSSSIAQPRFIKAPAANASGVPISITKNGFSPADVVINQRQVVTWTNKEERSYQLASPDLKGFGGTSLSKEASYSFKFEQKGTFSYHDELNSSKFKGTIVVK